MTTVEKIIAKVRELAAASPENKYIGFPDYCVCYYTAGKCSDGTEGCIIGQALVELGLLNKCDLLVYYLHKGEFHNDTMFVTKLFEKLNIKLSLVQKEWLWKVQSFQDRKHSWSSAVNSADAHVALFKE